MMVSFTAQNTNLIFSVSKGSMQIEQWNTSRHANMKWTCAHSTVNLINGARYDGQFESFSKIREPLIVNT